MKKLLYLALLIDDLYELWRGLNVIDATKPRGLQAIKPSGYLAWTIIMTTLHMGFVHVSRQKVLRHSPHVVIG